MTFINRWTVLAALVFCSATPALTYQGYLDSHTCSTIAGWAWNGTDDTAINVDLYDGTTLMLTVPANQFRGDLLSAGKGNGVHAFYLSTPPVLIDGKAHTLSAKYGGTNLPLTLSPQTLTCNPNQQLPPYQYYQTWPADPTNWTQNGRSIPGAMAVL